MLDNTSHSSTVQNSRTNDTARQKEGLTDPSIADTVEAIRIKEQNFAPNLEEYLEGRSLPKIKVNAPSSPSKKSASSETMTNEPYGRDSKPSMKVD